MSSFPTLQNSLLDEVVRLGAVLESVVDFVLQQPSIYEPDLTVTITHLKLSALQLLFRSLQSGGNAVT